MPLDPVLAQGVTPINFAGPDPATKMNQLAMMMKMQGLQQEGQLNALKLTETQREMADVEAMREAIRGGADFRDPKVGARFGAKGAAMSKALLDADSADLDRKTKIAVAGRDIWLGINNQATYEAKLPELEALSPGSTRNLPRMFTPELKAENLMDAKAFFDQYKPTDYERTVTAAGYPKGSPEYTRLMRQKANLDSTRAPTEAGRPPADVQTVQWLMTQPPDVQEMFFKIKAQSPGYSIQATDQGLVAVNTKNPTEVRLLTLPNAVSGVSGAAPGAAPGVSPTNALGATPSAAPAATPSGGAPLMRPKGKDTTASEQRDTFAIRQVLSNAQLLNDALANDPSALQPSLSEAAVSNTPVIKGLAGATQSESRQIVSASFRDILDSALYLATGAAYNREQLAGKLEALVPNYLDKPAAIAAKKQRVLNTIADAKARSGSLWTPELENSFNTLVTAMFPGKAAGGAPAGATGKPPLSSFD